MLKEQDEKKRKIEFDTHFFDDEVKINIYQKNSLLKSNFIGKGVLSLKDASFDKEGTEERYTSIVCLPVINKKLEMTVGYIYLKLSYAPRSYSLYELNQLSTLGPINTINKFEYFDSLLLTNFNIFCHYGFLQVKLNSVDIPASTEKQ